LQGSVGEAIVNLWLYFYHSVEGVAYNIIPLKSDNLKNVGYNAIHSVYHSGGKLFRSELIVSSREFTPNGCAIEHFKKG